MKHLEESYETATGLYKLFTCEKYRNIVFDCLVNQLQQQGLLIKAPRVILGLAAGKIYQNRDKELEKLFETKGWFLWKPSKIADDLKEIAGKGYANDPFILTAKVLLN